MSNQPVIVWFTQDLRLADNACLHKAAASGQPVVPVYILDDVTPGEFAAGAASRWWLQQSLSCLASSIRALGGELVLRGGESCRVLCELIEHTNAGAVYFSRGYAPWSGKLEVKIEAACSALGVECKRFSGYLLHEPEAIRTGSDGPYKVYTPFARNCLSRNLARRPRPAPVEVDFYPQKVPGDSLADLELYRAQPDWAGRFSERWTPGETGAQDKLALFLGQAITSYHRARDLPGVAGTSRLSPHLHFGEISPLQCWTAIHHAMAGAHGSVDLGGQKFLGELLWREFSYHLLHHWPTLPTEPFKTGFCNFPWRDDTEHLQCWKQGQTGYPIVDAGMRELWVTGWMHNRVRMIVGSFLVKNLRIAWQHGEQWFRDTLVDADIGANSAGWQWIAGCGADAAPYFRIFNPVLQGERFDSDGAYVREWVPELRAVPARYIHKPWSAPAQLLRDAGVVLGGNYPHPIVDLSTTRAAALAAYKTIKQQD